MRGQFNAVTCSEVRLNWKEEAIMVIINLLAQMQSLHLSELTQCVSLQEIS